jgi:hypothetical protein
MLKWTFLDFDAQQVNKRQKKKFGEESPADGEEMRVLLEGDNHVLHEYYTSATATGTTTGANTSLTISEVVEDGKTYLNIRGKESQEDNPEHPLGLTEAQQQVAIGLLFKDTSNFEAEFKLESARAGVTSSLRAHRCRPRRAMIARSSPTRTISLKTTPSRRVCDRCAISQSTRTPAPWRAP